MTRIARIACPALLALLLLPGPALAGGKDDAAPFVPFIAALLGFLPGLAVHYLILAFAPRRGQSLVHALEGYRGRTMVIGLACTFLMAIVAAFTHKAAPAIALLAILVWGMLAFVGSFGIAMTLGTRVLGRASVPAPPGDARVLAMGWFVLLFAVAFPGLGLLAGLYWAIRATGGVVLALLTVPPPAAAGACPEPGAAEPGSSLQ